jgi:hypothetical protein
MTCVVGCFKTVKSSVKVEKKKPTAAAIHDAECRVSAAVTYFYLDIGASMVHNVTNKVGKNQFGIRARLGRNPCATGDPKNWSEPALRRFYRDIPGSSVALT